MAPPFLPSTVNMKFPPVSFLFIAAMLFIACQHHSGNAPQPGASNTASTGDALPWAGDQDLVCGMKVTQSAEDTVHYGGKIYGFCGADCKEQFQQNPAQYVQK